MKKSELPLQSDAEVAALYRALRRVARENRFTIEDVFDRTFVPKLAYGAGYLDNFRKGKIDRARAARLYGWLRDSYPEYANDLDAEIARLNARPVAELWEAFIQARGVFGQISVDRPDAMEQKQYQVERLTREQWEKIQRFQETQPLNVPFRFYLRSPFVGHVTALQWLRGSWFGLPLEDGKPGIAFDEPVRSIPPHRDQGLPIEDTAFNEPNETGLHRFVFILTDAETGPGIAERLRTDHAIDPAALERFVI